MLEVADRHKFVFDTLQMPNNVMDAHYRSFRNLVMPELQKRNLAILGMKSLGDSVILKTQAVTAMECLHYSLAQPVAVQITGIDKPEILDQAIKAAQTYQQITKDQMNAILARTAPHAVDGRWEIFKTSAVFDSTATHPQWLRHLQPACEKGTAADVVGRPGNQAV